jgi:hypothetical protein
MQRIKDGELSTKEGDNQLIEYYENRIGRYTYLSPNGKER